MRTTILFTAFILATSVTAQAGLVSAKAPQSTTVAVQPTVPAKSDNIRQLVVPDPAGVTAPSTEQLATAPDSSPPSAARPPAAQQQAIRKQQMMHQRKMQQARMQQMKQRQMRMSDDDDGDDEDLPRARRGSAKMKMKMLRSLLDD